MNSNVVLGGRLQGPIRSYLQYGWILNSIHKLLFQFNSNLDSISTHLDIYQVQNLFSWQIHCFIKENFIFQNIILYARLYRVKEH